MKKRVSFTDIPVIFAKGDRKYEENIGLDTKEERKQFIDWFHDTYSSYSEDIRKEEGITEEDWEDYQWEFDLVNFYLPDLMETTIANLPKGKIKFKIIKPGTLIYRVNLSKNLEKYNLWFFPEKYSPLWHNLESYGLFSDEYYLLQLKVIKPLFLVDMSDLNTVLRLMMDKRYYKQEESDVPFALAILYASLGDWGLHRTSIYKN